GGARRVDRGVGLRAAGVMELADGRVAGREHLTVGLLVQRGDVVGRQRLGLRQHRLAPGPEVVALDSPSERALERVAVSVDEAGNGERRGVVRHAAKTGSPASTTVCTMRPPRW